MFHFIPFTTGQTSRQLAKDRLKLLLLSEKVACTADDMEQMQSEIQRVVSKYIDLQRKRVEVHILDLEETEIQSRTGSIC